MRRKNRICSHITFFSDVPRGLSFARQGIKCWWEVEWGWSAFDSSSTSPRTAFRACASDTLPPPPPLPNRLSRGSSGVISSADEAAPAHESGMHLSLHMSADLSHSYHDRHRFTLICCATTLPYPSCCCASSPQENITPQSLYQKLHIHPSSHTKDQTRRMNLGLKNFHCAILLTWFRAARACSFHACPRLLRDTTGIVMGLCVRAFNVSSISVAIQTVLSLFASTRCFPSCSRKLFGIPKFTEST